MTDLLFCMSGLSCSAHVKLATDLLAWLNTTKETEGQLPPCEGSEYSLHPHSTMSNIKYFQSKLIILHFPY